METSILANRVLLANRNGALASLIFLLGWIFAAQTHAQDFERYRPHFPEGRGKNEAELPKEPQGAGGSPAVLVDHWRAIVFIDHKDQLVAEGLEADGVVVAGDLPLLQCGGADKVAQQYLGGEISLLRLNQLVRDVILLYRNNNQPVVDVSVPVQKISNGVVQIIVTEGRVGQVRVTGPCYFDPCVLLKQTRICHGQRIFESSLIDDLEWLSRSPYRNVNLELSPGEVEGFTDIEYQIEDRMPWRAYAGYEDTGTRQTGIERTIYGVSWSNAFDRDHQLGYQFSGSSDFNQLAAHSLIYEIPLANRDRLQFYGSFAEVNGDALGLFGVNGRAWQVATRYFYELPCNGCDNCNHQIVAGADFKRTNTNLEFGGQQVFNSSADIVQFTLGYHGAKRTGLGSLVWRLDGVYGPSGLSGGNNSVAYQTIRAGAQSDYLYGRAFLEQTIPLGCRLNFIARLTGQIADGNLLPSEQLGFGGYYSIRGYDMRLINGDSGYVGNLEIATDPIQLCLLGDDQIQYLAFHDFGDSYNHTLLPGEDRSVDLSSVGVGLRYGLSSNFSLRADYAWQTAEVALLRQPRQRAHIAAVIAY